MEIWSMVSLALVSVYFSQGPVPMDVVVLGLLLDFADGILAIGLYKAFRN